MSNLTAVEAQYDKRLVTAVQKRSSFEVLGIPLTTEETAVLKKFAEFLSIGVARMTGALNTDILNLSFGQVEALLGMDSDLLKEVFLPVLWAIPKFTENYAVDSGLNDMVATACSAILTYPMPETEEEAHKFNLLSVALLTIAPIRLGKISFEVTDTMSHKEVVNILNMFLTPAKSTKKHAH